LHLPPYISALTTTENAWAYPRANKLYARVWNSYDDILEAGWQAWPFLINQIATAALEFANEQRSMRWTIGITTRDTDYLRFLRFTKNSRGSRLA